MPSESYIEKTCSVLANKAGFHTRKMQFIADVGCPDRIFFKENKFFWVEFKNKNGVLSEMQKYQINLLKKANQEVYVIDNIEVFKKIIGV